MRPSSVIGHVREATESFLGASERPADQRLREFYRGRRYLGSRDRRAISEFYYRLIRQYRRYLPYVSAVDHDREVPPPESVPMVLALLLSVQSDFTQDEILEGCGIEDNLLLRALGFLEAAAGSAEDDVLSFNRGYPEWLVNRLRILNKERLPALLDALDDEADIGIRFDSHRLDRADLLTQFGRAGYEGVLRTSPWTDDGLVMTARGVLSKIPAIRDGRAVVQDIGSQMISLAADPQPGWKVLDACAGAGGKTLHIADLLRGSGRVVAHDAVPSRLDRLVERISRSGRRNIKVLYPDEFDRIASDLFDSFDLVLVDAPCSGTGTFRRNPGLKLTLLPEDVSAAVSLQRSIIERYSSFVRPGGRLLYATCSLLDEENDEVVEWFIRQTENGFDMRDIRSIPEEMIDRGVMRLRPDRHGTDGFYAALMERAH